MLMIRINLDLKLSIDFRVWFEFINKKKKIFSQSIYQFFVVIGLMCVYIGSINKKYSFYFLYHSLTYR
jgi:hypothetical protein